MFYLLSIDELMHIIFGIGVLVWLFAFLVLFYIYLLGGNKK